MPTQRFLSSDLGLPHVLKTACDQRKRKLHKLLEGVAEQASSPDMVRQPSRNMQRQAVWQCDCFDCCEVAFDL